ncbi:MAG: hypothetical protein ACLUN5_08025 [Oscillospiraceae bacterium]
MIRWPTAPNTTKPRAPNCWITRPVPFTGTARAAAFRYSQNRAEDSAMQLSGDAALTATRTLLAEEAERLGVSESAPVAETAQRYYNALLQTPRSNAV